MKRWPVEIIDQTDIVSPLRRVLDVREAAEALGVHINTIKRIPPSELPFFRVRDRGDRRYRLVDIEGYIERRMER